MQLTLITHNETETETLGAALGRLLQPGDVLALVGDLGAGKTCLARGVARGLGIDEPVTSPTFILVAQYATAAGFPLYHADCYRLEQAAAEALDIGLDELLLDDGVAIVEWAERIESLLPARPPAHHPGRAGRYPPRVDLRAARPAALAELVPENCEW